MSFETDGFEFLFQDIDMEYLEERLEKYIAFLAAAVQSDDDEAFLNDEAFDEADKYYNGIGVTTDYEEALKWYRLSAERGNKFALYRLGEMYYYGEGVDQDYSEAVKWYLRAAEAGHVFTPLRLGEMYHRGEGVEQDYNKAFNWYRRALALGDPSAEDRMAELIEELEE